MAKDRRSTDGMFVIAPVDTNSSMKTAGGHAMNFFIGGGIALAVLALVELARAVLSRGLTVERFAGVAYRFRGNRRRAALAIAVGPIAAYLAICVIAFVAYYADGVADERLFLREAMPGYDAVTKLEPGDQILTVDGQRVTFVRDVVQIVNAKRGAAVTLAIVRDGKPREIEVTPREDNGTWRLGTRLEYGNTKDAGFAAKHAWRYPMRFVGAIIDDFAVAIRGRPEADPGGPVRIVQEFTEAYDREYRITLANVAFAGAGLSTYLWLLIVLVDLVRLAMLLRRHPERS
jgi:membrane-associated protease RseP (regulator of RpoE activity)